ncbi:unnamed protein product, partial [Protopolystoma xenopodis]
MSFKQLKKASDFKAEKKQEILQRNAFKAATNATHHLQPLNSLDGTINKSLGSGTLIRTPHTSTSLLHLQSTTGPVGISSNLKEDLKSLLMTKRSSHETPSLEDTVSSLPIHSQLISHRCKRGSNAPSNESVLLALGLFPATSAITVGLRGELQSIRQSTGEQESFVLEEAATKRLEKNREKIEETTIILDKDETRLKDIKDYDKELVYKDSESVESTSYSRPIKNFPLTSKAGSLSGEMPMIRNLRMDKIISSLRTPGCGQNSGHSDNSQLADV